MLSLPLVEADYLRQRQARAVRGSAAGTAVELFGT